MISLDSDGAARIKKCMSPRMFITTGAVLVECFEFMGTSGRVVHHAGGVLPGIKGGEALLDAHTTCSSGAFLVSCSCTLNTLKTSANCI